MPFVWRKHDREPLEERFERGAARTPIQLQAASETKPRHDDPISHFLGAIDAAEAQNTLDSASFFYLVVFVSPVRGLRSSLPDVQGGGERVKTWASGDVARPWQGSPTAPLP
jgi:hypothetical protein